MRERTRTRDKPKGREEQGEEPRGPRGRGAPAPPRRRCAFCAQGIKDMDYKNADALRRFVTDRGKIQARRRTHLCAKHQRRLALAVKRARHLALLPFTAEHVRAS